MARIGLKGVRKSFGSITVLHGIDLEIADGEFIVLLGPSGSGKSTLLRCINGLETFDSGRIARWNCIARGPIRPGRPHMAPRRSDTDLQERPSAGGERGTNRAPRREPNPRPPHPNVAKPGWFRLPRGEGNPAYRRLTESARGFGGAV